VEKILELAKKVTDSAEVFSVSSEYTSVQFEANRLKHIQGKQSTNTSIRIIKNGRIGYATASGEVDRIKLVNMAVETAQFGMPAKFEFPSSLKYPDTPIFDQSVLNIKTEQMIKLGEELIAPLQAHTRDIVSQAGISRSEVTVQIGNSNGGSAKYNKTIFSIGVEGTVVHGTDMLFVGDGDSSCHPILESKNIIDLVLEQLEYAKTQAQISTKQLPVIFTPNGVASAFIPALTAAFNGKLVLEGASPLGNYLGETFFDTKLSLWDDATLAYFVESRPCDDEGVPSRRTPLIEKGVVTNFIYDLQTAGMANKQSTGNGSRDRGLPAPAYSSLLMAAGNVSFKDMVKDINEGLVIEQLMGAEQGNILGGDFSGNVLLGYKIENGNIIGRVKDTMVSGNIYKLLKNIVALGSELRSVGGSLQVPHIYCAGLSVASR
jgi:PmbA protein